MPRAICVLLILVALAATPAATYAQPSTPDVRVAQVDTSHYPEVTLHVRVTGPDGLPQPGLRPQDFALTEEGTSVQVAAFEPGGSTPVSALLAIDCSGSMGDEGKIDGARAAADAFVNQMRPGDQTALLTFCGPPQLVQGFTGDTARLHDQISAIDAGGPTPLYDSLIAATDALQGQSGRQALVLLTDGRDCRFIPCMVPASQASLDTAINHAHAAGLAVEVIGLGTQGGSGDGSIDEPVLRQIADQTGGEYFHAPSADQLASLYQRLGGSFQQEYTLTYVSPRPFYDGTRRDIQVQVGTVASSGAYTEQHLINVQSTPQVGGLLLVPLLALLVLPMIFRRRNKRLPPLPETPQPTAHAEPTAALPAAPETIVAHGNSCETCGAALRPGARFCGECGQSQTVTVPAARATFCDQCGEPMTPGTRFCMSCGARQADPNMRRVPAG